MDQTEPISLTVEKNSGLSKIVDAYLRLQAKNPFDPRLKYLRHATRDFLIYDSDTLRELVPEPTFDDVHFPHALAFARHYKVLTQ